MKWVFLIFLGLYLVALMLLAIGTSGWFGQERDPLSGVFLIPLVAVLAPLINAGILYRLWRK